MSSWSSTAGNWGEAQPNKKRQVRINGKLFIPQMPTNELSLAGQKDVNRECGTEASNRRWLQPTTAIDGFVPTGPGLERILPLSLGFLPTRPGCPCHFRPRRRTHFASGLLDRFCD